MEELSVFTARMIMIGALSLSTIVPAQAANNLPDWPCVQGRVPTISAATMWSEPPLDDSRADEWRNDSATARLVKRLSLRRVTIEEAGEYLDEFSNPLSEAERLEKLPLVFQGVLQIINKERASIIRGIERYTRTQKKLATEVSQSREELEDALTNAKNDQEREIAQQKLDWQTRIHLDRERSLEFVCESPRLLEQRAFAIAREIQYRLP